MISIVRNRKKWNFWLSEMYSYDFYYTYEYHDTLKKNEEEPILIVFEEKGVKIAIPFLKRRIESKYFDLISIHGYLGPLSKNVPFDFDNTSFIEQFTELLHHENIVSVFSKLNPYIKNQEQIVRSLGSIEKVGELVFFDQSLDNESQIIQYNRNTRQKLKQLRKICTVKHVESEEEILSFIKLYHISMDGLNAKDIFYFKKDYFDTLLNSELVAAKILIAVHNGTNDIMGGVFCVETKEIVHIELACTNEKYYKNSPVRILFDASRMLYKNKDIKYLNLGGGNGGREGSLMRFKSSFTQDYTNFNVWKCIIAPELYDDLTTNEQKESDSDFFPKYRLKL